MSTKNYLFFFAIFMCQSFSVTKSNSIESLLATRLPLRDSVALMDSVVSGAQMAMDECKNVFKWDRWNCPQSYFSRNTKQPLTKESAFVDAIRAAGIIYSITRNCSKGEILGCGCDRNLIQPAKPSTDWSWGGCSEDASYAENIIWKFLHTDGKNNDVQTFIRNHNHFIGREIIRDTMVKKCRCHGVSGSCSLQTCWKQMPPFAKIARQLKERYDRAAMISFENVDGAIAMGNNASPAIFPAGGNKISNQLLYMDRSPDYCTPNNNTDWPGTKGRMCSRKGLESATLAERRSCRNLCRSCGHRVRKLKKTVTHRCNCKFMWCCEVKCDVCVENVEEFFCD